MSVADPIMAGVTGLSSLTALPGPAGRTAVPALAGTTRAGEARAQASDVVPTLAVEIHDPVDPAAYSTWVWVVGLALLVAIVAWYAWVLWWTRRRPAPDPADDPAHWSSLRETSLAKVDQAERRFRDGDSNLRALALDLNRIMREFSTARTGTDTTSLTVSEIAELDGTDRLADLLRDYSEPAFAYDSDAEALAATARAREVIGAW